MSIRRTVGLVSLLVPLVLFALLFTLPYYSQRLSVALHGHPFARIVAKERLNVFEFVATDSLRSKAIVFSHGSAIGWIYQPMMGLARFVSFSGTPDFDVKGFDTCFDLWLPVAWYWRWCFLPLQAIVLLLWLRGRSKRIGCSFATFALLPVWLLLGCVSCATQRDSAGNLSEKLGAIRIQEEKLSGSPKQIVKQLNKLGRKYDEPLHEGVAIGNFCLRFTCSPFSLRTAM
jgi:hypothetical protein